MRIGKTIGCAIAVGAVALLPTVVSLKAETVAVPEEEGRFTVAKVVRLPRNGRPCAYLQRA